MNHNNLVQEFANFTLAKFDELIFIIVTPKGCQLEDRSDFWGYG